MGGSSGDDESLPRQKLDGTVFQVDEQSAFDDIKEFVIIVVFMPVILAIDDAKTDH